MPRLLLILLLYFVSLQLTIAQPAISDNLRTVLLRHPQADTFRVNRLNDLAQIYGQRAVSIGDSLAEQALVLARQLHYDYGQAQALLLRANLKVSTLQPKEARQLLDQALALAEPLGDKGLLTRIIIARAQSHMRDGDLALPDHQQAIEMAKTTHQPILIAESKGALGTFYAFHFMYASALNYYFQALRAAEQAHATGKEVSLLHQIAGVYLDLTDYKQALTYLQQALKKTDPQTEAEEIVILGDLGNCYMLTGQYLQAIAALQKGLALSKAYKERPNYYGLPLESNLADTYERQRNALALPFARRVINKARQLQDAYVSSRVAVTLARCHLRTGQLDSAIYYGQQAIQFSQQDQNKIRLRDASQVLAEAYAKRHEFAQAYTHLVDYLIHKDSINNDEMIRKTTAALFNDQMSRQQGQIKLLTKNQQLQSESAQRQRQLLYALLAVLALIGSLVVVLYRNNRQKQKINLQLQHQKTEILAQRDQIQQALNELKTTQKQLVQKEKMASLGELTAGIAHEIQNPLNFVNNFSTLSTDIVEELEEAQHQPERVPDLESELVTDLKVNLHKINQHGQQASNIVKGMLEHARMATGERQPTAINALASEYLRLSFQAFKAKNQNFTCELVTDFDPAVGQGVVVAQDVGRVLLNLLNNAFYAVQQRQKASDSSYQPMVRISTQRLGNIVLIQVADNGTGIAENIQSKIFQPFFTTKPPGQGTGLGLSLSYEIITVGHGGNLTVESRPGEGTSMRVQLPV